MADGDKAKSLAALSDADKLRKVFNGIFNVAEFVNKGLYDERDVENVKTNDLYVRQFIRSYESLEDAAKRLHETLKWRKEIKINDMKEETFPLWVWQTGAIFFHNHDKDGRKLLLIRVKEHKKDPEKLPGVKAFFAYHMEMAYRENPQGEVVILFDMADTGMSNLDMELIRFTITCFKIYYPAILGYMLIFEMPWLFNAAWRIIKGWLSAAAIKKIKFVYKNDIQEYINKDQLMEHMGGTDKFKYAYTPPDQRGEDDSKAAKKRVTFADQDPSIYRSLSADNLKELSPPSKNSSLTKRSVHSTKKMDADTDNSFIGRLLTITPAEELEFTIEENVKETYDVISLKNTLPYPIAFKVKTTSPEKYKVRPSFGVVKPGTVSEVYVYLLQASQMPLGRDRFLIMAMEVTSEVPDNLQELWKTTPKENIMEHKLRCSQTNKNLQNSASNLVQNSMQDQITSLTAKMDSLIERNKTSERTLRLLVALQSLVILCLVLYWLFGSAPSSVSSNSSYCTGNLF